MQVQANSPVVLSGIQNPAGNRVAAETLQKPVPDPQAKPIQATQSPATQQEIEAATKKLQGFVDSVRSDIQFSMDQDSGKTVVKVVDKQTNDVLMQFPSEEALNIARSLDKLQGLLIKQKA